MADDLWLFENRPAQAESLMSSLEQAAKNIGLYMNTDKQSSCVLHKMEPYPRSMATL